MPEPDKKSRRSLKNLPPDRFQPKMLLFWFVLVGAVVALLVLTQSMVAPQEVLTVQDVVERAEAGNIFHSDLQTEKNRNAIIRPTPSDGPFYHVISGEF
jgi:cell division protease FtsH